MVKQNQKFLFLIGFSVTAFVLLLTFIFWLGVKVLFPSDDSKPLRVALLLQGPTYDQGWNSSAVISLTRLKDTYGFELEIASDLQPGQYAVTASSYGEKGFDLVFGHGNVFSDPFVQVAGKYPKTRFVTLNGRAVYPNQTAILHNMEPAGYLVGKLSALMSKSKKVGFIYVDKPHEEKLKQGFLNGVRETDPNVEAVLRGVSSYYDVEHALEAAHSMIKQGVDVIFTAGDSYNFPVIAACQEANIYAIGYITDQRYMAPNHVLASLIQDVGQIYNNTMQDFVNNRLPSGEITYALQGGVNRLSSFGPMVPQHVQEEMLKTIHRLKEATP